MPYGSFHRGRRMHKRAAGVLQAMESEAGPVVMQEVGAALVAGCVPLSWEAEWEGPAVPLAYCREVAEKAAALQVGPSLLETRT